MDDQIILAVDHDGRFHGEYVSRHQAHAGEGIHHLAITLFIFNSRGDVLLQRRKHRIFDNIWDNTGSTHQHHLASGHDESDEEAARRCLKNEWGIENIALENLGGFNYFARDGDRCENEYCKVLTGVFDGEFSLNPAIAYEYRWMDGEEFLRDLEKHPQKYSPWCREAAKLVGGKPRR